MRYQYISSYINSISRMSCEQLVNNCMPPISPILNKANVYMGGAQNAFTYSCNTLSKTGKDIFL